MCTRYGSFLNPTSLDSGPEPGFQPPWKRVLPEEVPPEYPKTTSDKNSEIFFWKNENLNSIFAGLMRE